MNAAEATALRVVELTRSFGGLRALEGVSFDVRPGELFGIVGPNGAGKTTLLNCISGVDPPESGSIWLGDRRLTGIAAHRVAALGVARTFQSADFFGELTVQDYVMVGCVPRASSSVLASGLGLRSARRTEREETGVVLDLLEEFNLIGAASVRLENLPYGTRKIVDIVRALNARPRVLLLDEPTSGTSAEDRISIRDLLSKIKSQGVSILVVDHDIRFISDTCDRLLAMNFGKRLGLGVPAEVLNMPDVVASYLGPAQ